MTVYQVWDHDPMDGSAGHDYCAETFKKKTDAMADCDRRNAAWKAFFVKNAMDGVRRAETEPWNWQHAHVKPVTLK